MPIFKCVFQGLAFEACVDRPEPTIAAAQSTLCYVLDACIRAQHPERSSSHCKCPTPHCCCDVWKRRWQRCEAHSRNLGYFSSGPLYAAEVVKASSSPSIEFWVSPICTALQGAGGTTSRSMVVVVAVATATGSMMVSMVRHECQELDHLHTPLLWSLPYFISPPMHPL